MAKWGKVFRRISEKYEVREGKILIGGWFYL